MFIISMILNVFVILLLIVVEVRLIKRYNEISKKEKEPVTKRVSHVDSFGIEYTREYDVETGHIKLLIKSNGEFYEFENDEEGRLVYYRNHLGVHYRCEFNGEGQVIYIKDYTAGTEYEYEYDELGRLVYRFDVITGEEQFYHYNENGEVYLTEDGEGRKTYVLGKLPKKEGEKDE